MTRLINCTAHPICVYDPAGEHLLRVIEKSGHVARVETSPLHVGSVHKMPVYVENRGAVRDLPAPRKNTFYIVSTQVRLALPERCDLLSPYGKVTSFDGAKYGCRGFAANEAIFSLEEL